MIQMADAATAQCFFCAEAMNASENSQFSAMYQLPTWLIMIKSLPNKRSI